MNPRTLRHNLEAEASVLGGVILRNDVLVRLDTLELDDFYDHRHKVTWEAIRNLEAQQRPIDVVTLEIEIERKGKLAAIGGIAFLGELTLRVPTADNVVAYAETVKQLAATRRLALLAGDLLERCYDWNADAEELLSEAIVATAKLDTGRKDGSAPVGDFVKRRVRELETQWAARARGEIVWNGAPTGVKKLDGRIGGYPFGDVVLIAARPAMGKTALATAAVTATVSAGYGAHVFSAEGGWRMYADRLIARVSDVSVEQLRTGALSDAQATRVSHAMMRYGLLGPRWRLDDTGGLSATDIVRRVHKHRREIGTRLVVVDYINILRRKDNATENEALEQIVNVFGQEAPNTDIAWVILCQLNRKVEDRPDKRPVASDLRGSGALEQVGRIVVSPYRGAVYSENPKRNIDYDCDCVEGTRECAHKPTPEQFAQQAQVLLLKNNNGETGRVFASWKPTTMEIW